MTEICGWFGAIGNRDESARRTWLGTPPGQSIPAQQAFGAGFGWQVSSGVGAHHAHVDSDGGLCIVGRAFWRGELLAAGSLPALRVALASDFRAVLGMLRGHFLLLAHDARADRLLLATDRMGVYPLAFADCGGALVFASDARHVARNPLVSAGVSSQGIFNYLYAHMVPSPGTIFNGVDKLLPAQYLLREGGRTERDFYWRMPYEDGRGWALKPASDELKAVLAGAVRRAAGDGQTGCFLSGGTDSTTVSGVLSQQCSEPVDTYSIGFDVEGYDEMEYARIAKRRFGFRPHEYYVTPADVVKAVPRVAAAYDEPFGNASAVPTLYCSEMAAADGKTVLLAGDGGDELFGGNARYAKQKVFEIYQRLPAGLRSGLLEPLLLGNDLTRMGPLRKVRSYIEQARIPLPDRLESYNFLERGSLGDMFAPDFLASIDHSEPAMIAREVYGRAPPDQPVNCMMHLDLKQTLADNDLRKVTRMCALAGVEVRYPLLDDEVVEFSARVPIDWKVNGGQLRWFFKEALKDFLPQEIITKSKHGFGLPFGAWMRTDDRLRELAYDSLITFRKRRVLQSAYVDALIESHRSDDANYYGVMIWVLMMLEQWLQANEPGQG